MYLADAKFLCISGGLSGAVVYQREDTTGWSIRFESFESLSVSLDLETQKGNIRVFKRLKIAVSALKRIGFTKASLEFTASLDL